MGFLLKWIIAIAIIYYIIKHFIFPIFQISLFTNSKIKQMQDKMKEMEQKMNQSPSAASKKGNRRDGDYIDYEEIK